MAEKFKVKVYYEYAIEVEVEADTINEAYEKGIAEADEMDESNLKFIQTKDTDVYVYSNGDVHNFNENGKYCGIIN